MRTVGHAGGMAACDGIVAPFPPPWDRRSIATFDRLEWIRILDLYGRMVAAGQWRDYALRFEPEVAVFAAFCRHSERPDVRIEKHPRLRLKQGTYALVSEQGVVLKRGHDLNGILAPLERRFMRLVG